MKPRELAKKSKKTMRNKNEDQLATAIAATETREAAYKNKPKAFVIKEPVVGVSSASGSAELDTPHGAWQLLDSDATIDTYEREDETKTAVCADTSKTAAVAEDPAMRDSHMDATDAHTSPLEPVATATFAECVKQSPDLQRSCISEKEVEPQDMQLADWDDDSETEEAPEVIAVAKTEIKKEEKETKSANASCDPLNLFSRSRSRKRSRSRETSVSIERCRVKCRRKNWSTSTQIAHAGLELSLIHI